MVAWWLREALQRGIGILVGSPASGGCGPNPMTSCRRRASSPPSSAPSPPGCCSAPPLMGTGRWRIGSREHSPVYNLVDPFFQYRCGCSEDSLDIGLWSDSVSGGRIRGPGWWALCRPCPQQRRGWHCGCPPEPATAWLPAAMRGGEWHVLGCRWLRAASASKWHLCSCRLYASSAKPADTKFYQPST